MRKTPLTFIFLIVLASSASICTAQNKQQPDATSNGTSQAAQKGNGADRAMDEGRPQLLRRNPRYRLRPTDIVSLTFPLTPEFDQEVTVQPDGFIQLKGLLDEVRAEGLVIPELIETIRTAYSKVLHDPVITVVLKDFEKPYFVAGGEVGQPGKYDLRGETTVTQAIAIAGGFGKYARHSRIFLFRRYSDDWVEVKVLNVKRMLDKRDLREDVTLRPGDMLYVPKSAYAKVEGFLPRSSLGLFFNPSQF